MVTELYIRMAMLTLAMENRLDGEDPIELAQRLKDWATDGIPVEGEEVDNVTTLRPVN